MWFSSSKLGINLVFARSHILFFPSEHAKMLALVSLILCISLTSEVSVSGRRQFVGQVSYFVCHSSLSFLIFLITYWLRCESERSTLLQSSSWLCVIKQVDGGICVKHNFPCFYCLHVLFLRVIFILAPLFHLCVSPSESHLTQQQITHFHRDLNESNLVWESVRFLLRLITLCRCCCQF